MSKVIGGCRGTEGQRNRGTGELSRWWVINDPETLIFYAPVPCGGRDEAGENFLIILGRANHPGQGDLERET